MFGHGTQIDGDQAYALLTRELGSLGDYKLPVIFYAKGYGSKEKSIFKTECRALRCTSKEQAEGWQACSTGAKTTDEVCIPLAAVFNGKLYCLWQPVKLFSEDAPFAPYVPPLNR